MTNLHRPVFVWVGLLFLGSSESFSWTPAPSFSSGRLHACSTSNAAPLIRRARNECVYSSSRISLAQSSDEVERLRESASKLRQEAETLRAQLGEPKREDVSGADASSPQSGPAITYSALPDSAWSFIYRFSNEPDDDSAESKDDSEPTVPRINYSGQLTVRFRSDGYTDLLKHQPTGASRLDITKVWGWDEDISSEDDQSYVSFSTNARLTPTSDEARFYWQARIDKDSNTNVLSLADGTVTVKRDVRPPGGFWGFLDGKGILAQFRYVGNFAGKPFQAEQT